MTGLYYAAACQTDFVTPQNISEIGANTTRMCEMIEQTIVGYEPFFDVRLLVFPEFAHAVPIYQTVSELKQKLSMPIPNEHTDRYEKLCKKYGCYVQSGSFLEVDDAYPGALFNTTVLIGPSGILSKYRKVNTWIPWEVHTSPHDIETYQSPLFPVIETEIGRLGVAICYDWLFPETIRQLAFNGADVLIRVSAYMNPWGTAEPMNWWGLVNRTRALENTAFVVASNQGAQFKHYPPFCWPGGSMIVDYDGRVLSQADAGPGEAVVVAPINVDQLSEERSRRFGHDTLAHFRSEAHDYYQREYIDKGGSEVMTIDRLKQRIQLSKSHVKVRRDPHK